MQNELFGHAVMHAEVYGHVPSCNGPLVKEVLELKRPTPSLQLTFWSNVTLHVVDAVGVNLPTGDTELDRADGPVTIIIDSHYITLCYTMLTIYTCIPPPSRVMQFWPDSRLNKITFSNITCVYRYCITHCCWQLWSKTVAGQTDWLRVSKLH